MRPHLFIAAFGLFLSPLMAAESVPNELSLLVGDIEATQMEVADVPEPNSLLMVGIGSLAILFFAIRRK
jgi:hypothetical protein